MTQSKPVVLCILDGWGESDVREYNAIAQANTPNWDALRARYPFGLLEASESHVGLPAGQMGNSEVGHMNIGAGRVVMQDLPRIDAAVADGSIEENPELIKFIRTLRKTGGTCHLMGLLSDGGVHSYISHMAALATIVAEAGVPAAVHVFTDGRDVSPKSALDYIEALEEALPEGCGITTVSGRYYAMDRDNRWERLEKAYDAIVSAKSAHATTATDAVNASYDAHVTDEFIVPTVIGDYDGMAENDGVLMTNFRADRARQLLTALLEPRFDHFSRGDIITTLHALGMVEYSEALNVYMPAMFPTQSVENGLGEIVADAGLKQLRIAETEKYAHVTFFFNGGREEPFAGESRILVPSPNVATYDLQPEMSAPLVTDKLIAAIESGAYDFIVVNYANTDMVGHSGDISAAIKAVEAVDLCLGRLTQATHAVGGTLLITADHGNAECLHDADAGQAHTAHTLNPVPCLIVGESVAQVPQALGNGILADIAPTLCGLLGLPVPMEMTGRNLLAAKTAKRSHANS
jgi:2,3-bisphosphoglycerate-independent phosphoglycerate mutase